ncbi:hypothetical protein LINGRAHAP2_LOCUS15553 [Linum grandiflorum]
MVLQEQVSGTKSGWFGVRAADGSEMLLGFEIMSRLTENRSPMEAKSREFGGAAR